MRASCFEKFSGIYCSGSFVSNPSTLTALSLLFEEIYIPNNLELAVEFAKHYRFTNLPDKLQTNAKCMRIAPQDIVGCPDPISDLTETQQMVIKQYYAIASSFFVHYHDLVGPFIKTDLLKNGEVLDVRLVKEGMPGEKNTYAVYMNPLEVTLSDTGNGEFVNSLFSSGAVPIICDRKNANFFNDKTCSDINALSLACILAMKSIKLVIPPTRPADGETILEARYKLRDILPPFWSAVLKLSTELRKKMSEDTTVEQLLFFGQEIVDTTILPALIELKQKISKERKDWFHKIVYPIAAGARLLIGNSQLTPDGIARAGLYSSFDLVDGLYSQKRAVDLIKQESGLTFLLEVNKMFDKE